MPARPGCRPSDDRRARRPCPRAARAAQASGRAIGTRISTASCRGSSSTRASCTRRSDARNPLLERVKFLAIFAGNLDEFFQVRVAGLRRQQVERAAGRWRPTADDAGRAAGARSAQRVLELIAEHRRCTSACKASSRASSIEIVDYAADPGAPRRAPRSVSSTRSSRSSRRSPSTPAIRSRTSARSACRSRSGCAIRETGEQRFARVKVPPILPRLVEVEPDRFVLIDQVIEANLDELFPGMEIVETHLFRVTRDADLAIEEDEADDLLLAIEEELRRRRFGEAVRLEVERSMPAATRRSCCCAASASATRTATRSRGCSTCTGAVAARSTSTGRTSRPALDARHPAPARPAGRGRAHRRLRGHPGRRHPGPPPVRELLGVDRNASSPRRPTTRTC